MIKLNNILDEVLEEISLSQKEINILKKNSEELISILKKRLKKEDIIIGGSLAKGTLLKKDNQDVDLFVIFEDEEKSKIFSENIKKLKLDVTKIHGSREYFKLVFKGTLFEIIPIIKLKKDFSNTNSTDFSILHIDYIRKKTLKNKSLLDEIKLSKQFCIANEVYGAESYVQGFSGYALEILTCYYGSFMKFLKGIQKQDYIDIEKQFKNRKEAFRELNSSKLEAPIVLIDPTYKYRNVCAGLSRETFEKFRSSAKSFLKKPSRDYFKVKNFKLEEWLNQSDKGCCEVYRINIEIKRDNSDIAATKMKKFYKFVIRELEKKEQEIISNKFLFNGKDMAETYLIIKPKKEIKIKGPKKSLAEAVKNFKVGKTETYLLEGFIFAKEIVDIAEIFKKQEDVAKSMGVKFEFKRLK